MWKKKWLRKKKWEHWPNESDILLAKAYGGKPKASGKGLKNDGMSWISSRANMPPISNRFFDEDRAHQSKSKRTHAWQDSQLSGNEMGWKFEHDLTEFLGDSDEFEF